MGEKAGTRSHKTRFVNNEKRRAGSDTREGRNKHAGTRTIEERHDQLWPCLRQTPGLNQPA